MDLVIAFPLILSWRWRSRPADPAAGRMGLPDKSARDRLPDPACQPLRLAVPRPHRPRPGAEPSRARVRRIGDLPRAAPRGSCSRRSSRTCGRRSSWSRPSPAGRSSPPRRAWRSSASACCRPTPPGARCSATRCATSTWCRPALHPRHGAVRRRADVQPLRRRRSRRARPEVRPRVTGRPQSSLGVRSRGASHAQSGEHGAGATAPDHDQEEMTWAWPKSAFARSPSRRRAHVLAACGGGGSGGSNGGGSGDTPTAGGTLRWLTSQRAVQQRRPAAHLHRRGPRVLQRLHHAHADGVQVLEDPAEGTSIVPDMATDTGRSSNNDQTWEFTIKDGVKFAGRLARHVRRRQVRRLADVRDGHHHQRSGLRDLDELDVKDYLGPYEAPRPRTTTPGSTRPSPAPPMARPSRSTCPGPFRTSTTP